MKNFYLRIAILFCLNFIFFSCEKDNDFTELENEIDNRSEILEEIPVHKLPPLIKDKLFNFSFHSKVQNKFGAIRQDMMAKKYEDKKGVSYTFVLNKRNDETHVGNFFDNLVLFKNEESESIFIFRYIPDAKWWSDSKDFSMFSGKIKIFNDSGNSLGAVTMVEGEMKKGNSKSCAAEFYLGKELCTEVTDHSGESYGLRCTLTYDVVINCSGGGGTDSGGGTGYDNDSGPDVPDGLSNLPGGGGTTTPILPDPEEITVEMDVRLKDKELCAYNQLVYSGVNATNYVNLVTELFVEFGEGNIGGADLTIVSEDLGFNGGKTQYLHDGKFKIILSNMEDRSSIEIAAVLVHEMAHAFLAKHYFMYNKSFEELYKMYINDTGLQNYSHDIMKDKFISRMAQVLYDYDSSLFSNFNDYKTLASAGVYELDQDQLDEVKRIKKYAYENDERCN